MLAASSSVNFLGLQSLVAYIIKSLNLNANFLLLFAVLPNFNLKPYSLFNVYESRSTLSSLLITILKLSLAFK